MSEEGSKICHVTKIMELSLTTREKHEKGLASWMKCY
jgi:hypothetical protein